VRGSLTVPNSHAKIQVKIPMDLGGHNKNRSPSVQGPHFGL